MTRPNIIAQLLDALTDAKGRGIIEAAFPSGIPGWAGEDSDDVKFDCGVCGTAESCGRMQQCDHCDGRFCDHRDAACYDAHMDWVRRERRG